MSCFSLFNVNLVGGFFFLHTCIMQNAERKPGNTGQLAAEGRMCILKQSFQFAGVRSSGNKEDINTEWNLSKCNQMTL